MPPRIPAPQGLASLSLCLRPAARPITASLPPLIQKANLSKKERKQLSKQDPYRLAQLDARQAQRDERKSKFQAVRDAEWGDPIHGITTPFVESFDSAGQVTVSTPRTDANGKPLEEPHELPTSTHILDHQLTKAELDEALTLAYKLALPLEEANRTIVDPIQEEKERRDHEERHRKATIALERITSLSNSNGKSRRHANIRRCIEAFGRHNTDTVLRPKPLARGMESREVVPRAGPDTGSSEVQIAILTAKIRTLAQLFEGPKGHKDKFNRRNLRLLLHRRQKLLKYMQRKERGSERWQHLVQTLGLSPATWEKQIEV